MITAARSAPAASLDKATLDGLFRGVVWEIIFGGGDEDVLRARFEELRAAGAQWRDEDAATDYFPSDTLKLEKPAPKARKRSGNRRPTLRSRCRCGQSRGLHKFDPVEKTFGKCMAEKILGTPCDCKKFSPKGVSRHAEAGFAYRYGQRVDQDTTR
jgi:hypothetical protein